MDKTSWAFYISWKSSKKLYVIISLIKDMTGLLKNSDDLIASPFLSVLKQMLFSTLNAHNMEITS